MTQSGTTRQDRRLQSGLQLILWRHAEAEDAVPGLIADEARALTPRGHKQAAGMAKWLLERLLDKSPAAVRRGLYMLKKMEAMAFEESMAFTESQIALFTLTEDAREGQLAFQEKRKPQWSGK